VLDDRETTNVAKLTYNNDEREGVCTRINRPTRAVTSHLYVMDQV
jgi:hypothetical protein